MPLVLVALAAYVAGLFAGFANLPAAVVAAVGFAGIAGALRRPVVGLATAGLALSGVVVARTASGADARCLSGLAQSTSLIVRVDERAAPGGFVRGSAVECPAEVSLTVLHGAAPVGSVVRASGTVVPSHRGFLVQGATVELLAPAGRLVRWRERAGAAIDTVFGDDAPLVRALVIADRRGLSPAVRDEFAAAGLAHVLAIAGLHVGIIAGAILLLLELTTLRRPVANACTVGVIVFYVLLIGAPVPAVRAAVMLATLLLSRAMQRPTSRWAVVAIGAAHPVLAPRVVLEVGWQLSVVGVIAMIGAGVLLRRLGARGWPVVLRALAAPAAGAAVATVASAPIVAWTFGRVSLVAPVSNLVAAPLLALAQPMVFFGLVLSPVRPAARLLADAAHPLLHALEWTASTTAALPYASLVVLPTPATAAIGGGLSAAVLVACLSAEWIAPALVAGGCTALLLWLPIVPAVLRPSGMVELHMIDVGQGDAIALRTTHGHWVLFDAGRAWAASDAGRATILPYLGRLGGPLDAFVLSHPHTDHVGGAAAVLHALRPALYIDGGFPGPATAYRQSLAAARESHVEWRRAHPGDSIVTDGVTVTFLAPDSAWTAKLTDPNLASVVARVQVGDVRILLMGDAERAEEEWLLLHAGGPLDADILKVGHHGSATSSTGDFLAAVRPRLALVSVGAGNSYHLPTPRIMSALAAGGAQVLRTDRLGTIVVRTDGRRILVEADGDTWELPARSLASHSPPPDS